MEHSHCYARSGDMWLKLSAIDDQLL